MDGPSVFLTSSEEPSASSSIKSMDLNKLPSQPSPLSVDKAEVSRVNADRIDDNALPGVPETQDGVPVPNANPTHSLTRSDVDEQRFS